MKLKIRTRIFIIIMLIGSVAAAILFSYSLFRLSNKPFSSEVKTKTPNPEDIESEPVIEEEILSEEKLTLLALEEENLNDYLKKYQTSVIYFDLTTDYTYEYKKDLIYHGASLVKILSALYLYRENVQNNFDLYGTMKYESKYQMTFSYGMKTEKLGSEISFLTLIDYAMGLSDNTAYKMLYTYIGFDKLHAFALELGLKRLMQTPSGTMTIDANDALILIQELNKVLLNHEYGPHLKAAMINDHHNYFFWGVPNTKNVCKYGHVPGYYHNIGIIYEDENPYLVVVLTKHDKNPEVVIKDISEQIYNFHKLVHKKSNQN